MIQLIVNADDFGQTRGINAGIIRAHREGILTSATLMANGPAFENAVQLARKNPDLGVGVHLNLVEGRPLSPPGEVASLLDSNGAFVSKYRLIGRYIFRGLQLAELRKELAAQIKRVTDCGIVPTHVDSHKHIHAFPPFFRVVLKVLRDFGIGAVRLPLDRFRLRNALACPRGLPRTIALNAASHCSRRILRASSSITTTDHFAGTLRTGQVNGDWLSEFIRRLPTGTTELMVHPGQCDDELQNTSTRLTAERETELHGLTQPGVALAVKTTGVQLAHYGCVLKSGAEKTAYTTIGSFTH